MRPLPTAVALALTAASACASAQDPATDTACLRGLSARGISFEPLADVKDVQTPVQITGPIGPLHLVPRGRRAAVMDCTLAEALADAVPVFRDVGLTELAYSAAYDHRTRRGSGQLSAHAHGRAIDVHVLSGRAGVHVVERDFAKGAGAWRNLRPAPGARAACIGSPRTARGRALRTLVCRLKLETGLRTIVTPDDDADHRDHIHLETRALRPDERLSAASHEAATRVPRPRAPEPRPLASRR